MADDYLAPKFNFNIPEISPSLFKASQFVINAEQGIASQFHKRLIEWINDFHSSLDEEHEVGVRLVNFGQNIVFQLDNIRY